MRYPVFWGCMFALYALSCNNEGKSTATGQDTATANGNVRKDDRISFPSFFEFLEQQDSSFDAGLFQSEGTLAFTEPSSPIDTNALKEYLPYMVYNSDRSLATDIISYNYVPGTSNNRIVFEEAGPDFEAALLDIKKNTRTRLLFFGTTGFVYAARWENDHTALLAGIIDMEADSVRPALWRFDLHQQTKTVYMYPSLVRANMSLLKREIPLHVRTSRAF
ncbi:MAG TPA: hypothetical protein VFZ78_04470 [Flavisolibacter sp.]